MQQENCITQSPNSTQYLWIYKPLNNFQFCHTKIRKLYLLKSPIMTNFALETVEMSRYSAPTPQLLKPYFPDIKKSRRDILVFLYESLASLERTYLIFMTFHCNNVNMSQICLHILENAVNIKFCVTIISKST